MLDSNGDPLLLSKAFQDSQAAGQVNKRVQSGLGVDLRVNPSGYGIWLDGAPVAISPELEATERLDSKINRVREILGISE
jgi:tryptophanyl-tRNA synthetase